MNTQHNRTIAHVTYRTSGNLALQPSGAPSLAILEGGRQDVVAKAHVSHTDAGKAFAANESRMRVRALIACAIVTLAIVMGSAASDALRQAAHTRAFRETATMSVVVTPGDSLWSLAEEHPVEGRSTYEVSAWMREVNGLGSATLMVGQSLLVPAA